MKKLSHIKNKKNATYVRVFFVRIKIMKIILKTKKSEIIGPAHSICNLRCKVPKKFPVVSHNGSAYDWHFIIKHLPDEFEGQFRYLGENTEKDISFSLPIIKEVANDDGGKKEEEDDNDDYDDDDDYGDDDSAKKKRIKNKLSFIDSYRFMSCKLSDLVGNLSGIYDEECKSSKDRKNIKIKCKFIGYRNNRLHYKCKECNKPCTKSLNKAIKISNFV